MKIAQKYIGAIMGLGLLSGYLYADSIQRVSEPTCISFKTDSGCAAAQATDILIQVSGFYALPIAIAALSKADYCEKLANGFLATLIIRLLLSGYIEEVARKSAQVVGHAVDAVKLLRESQQ